MVSVEGRAVSSVEVFLQTLEPTGKPVVVQLLREGVPRELRLHRAFWKDYAVSADGPSVLGPWARPRR
ncbi:hypothetical protein [Stigmatella aurantiaca]|uniref:hypothetical protein n=1 Tax=Stigmatella aurantiaca TaxID=41 RepID=UPI001C4301E9|nr:hypothetical protein [Stigmatella aurantiaca]